MALAKVLGTETEYGITVRNQAEFNPVLASSTLINSYRGGRARIQWSFDEESPGRDARGFGYEDALPLELETGLVNVVLTNGARLYVDHAHPEYSTPECADPLEAALYDKAGEAIMAQAVDAARSMMPETERMFVHKNNSDGKGNSYGAHENYLVARAVPFGDIVRHFTGFLVTRQVFTGAGKIGSENGRPDVDFQITQRADFFEEEVGLETTLKRPIINTRDEPHADSSKYRRLHVIIGDATRSEVQTFLKLGSATLILNALEDGALPEALLVADPVHATWGVSHDLTLTRPIEMDDGRTMTAIEAQWQYLEWAKKYVNSSDLDRGLRRRRAGLGGGARRPRAQPVAARRPPGLGGEVPAPAGLPRPGRPGVDRPEAATARPPVPRHRPRSWSVRPTRRRRPHATALHRRGDRTGDDARPGTHPGLLSR